MSRKHKKQGFWGRPDDSRKQLLRKITSSGHWRDVQIETRPSGTEKMSDVILRFAAPLLNEAFDDSSYKFALEFCMVVWNLSLFPSFEQAQRRLDLIRELRESIPSENDPEVGAIIDMLLHRKRAYFSRYRRIIVDYTLSSIGDKLHLTVASTEVNF